MFADVRFTRENGVYEGVWKETRVRFPSPADSLLGGWAFGVRCFVCNSKANIELPTSNAAEALPFRESAFTPIFFSGRKAFEPPFACVDAIP